MAESNSETNVQHEKGLEILTADFEGRDDQDDPLDPLVDILANVLQENITNEKTKIVELKQEIQYLKNQEIEIDLHYAWAKQALSNRIDLKNNYAHLWVDPVELSNTFPEDKIYAILARERIPIERHLPGALEAKPSHKLVLKPRNPIDVILVNHYPETNEPNVQSMSVDESANSLLPSTSKTDTSEDKSNEKQNEDLDDQGVNLEEHEDYSDREEQEDENEAVECKAKDKDEAMEEDDSDDNNKSKVTSDTDPTEQEGKIEDGGKADQIMGEDNDVNVISAQVAVSSNLPPPSTSKTDTSEDKSNEKQNEDLDDQGVNLEEHEDYSDREEQEDENEAVECKAKDKDEAMEEDDLNGNNKFKVTTAQSKKQSLHRKAAQRQRFIQMRHYDIVKNMKNSIIKRKASPRKRLTVRGRDKENSTPASESKAKDDVSAEKENEKEVEEKSISKSRVKILGLNQQNNEIGCKNEENHPRNSRVCDRASTQDKVYFKYHDKIANAIQSLDKLCSLPSRRDYFFQLDKSKGVVDLFEITDPNIDLEKFDGPNVTDNFARPRIISRPQFEAFLRREMFGSGKEAAEEAQIKYRCPYCFMLSLSRDNIKRHIQSRKRNGEWRRPSCLERRLKEPNINGIYESKWPLQKRKPMIEIDCNNILIWIFFQLDVRIPETVSERKKFENLSV